MLALLAWLLLAPAPQAPRELNNTAWLPEVEGAEQQTVQQFEAELRAGHPEAAAALLDRLLERPPRRVVPCGESLRLSLRRYATQQLRSLPPAARAAWQETARSGIQRRLLAGGRDDPDALAATVARYPAADETGTLLLRLLDLALEQGDVVAAEAWLREATACGAPDLAPRAALLDRVRDRRRAGELWPCPGGGPERRPASGLTAAPGNEVRGLSLDLPPAEARGPLLPVCGTPVASAQLAAVVTGDQAVVLTEQGARLLDLAELAGVTAAPGLAPSHGSAPVPYLAGTRLYTVLGPRPDPRAGGTGLERHRLVGVDLLGKPRLLFARRNGDFPLDGVALDDEDRRTLTGVLSFADGMLALDERLYVVVTRPVDNTKVHAYLACLDAHTGQPLWLTFLCQGAPLSREPDWNRQEALAFPDTPPCPLAASQGLIVVGTNLGIVAAVDARSGELDWAYRYQRIPSGPKNPAGWPRTAVRVVDGVVLLAPTDATALYQLELLPTGQRSQRAAPRPRDECKAFLGASATQLYFVQGSDEQLGIVAIDRTTGVRTAAVPFLPGEALVGEPLLLQHELWCASQHALLRYDLQRDLYLDQRRPCEAARRDTFLGTVAPLPAGLLTVGRAGISLVR